MTTTAEPQAISIHNPSPGAPILLATGPTSVSIKAGSLVEIGDRTYSYDRETAIALDGLVPGRDYAVGINAMGDLFATVANDNPLNGDFFAGFHFAPGGNAVERKGGDSVPAINPHSLWDIEYRPACPDPRGMVRVIAGNIVWVDIYLLGADHAVHGTSRFGVAPATGSTLDLLDYPTAKSILEGHGKRLLTYDEFRTAAHGVTERSAAANRPRTTGLDAARTSLYGLMQATGNLWVWGTDGDIDDPRPSIFGGSGINGEYAGSRYAALDYWPVHSLVYIGARGASDHLTPA
ncbi:MULTISPECIES: hypothetical protein [unclassified Agrobacterium]|uniref:phage major tropism determinant n=1 Tax=unclassified Agrobacterium TaxID=2632611 RepID=UPI002447F9C6|nr:MULTISPECIES: hypothetical protein [unclassified Agrobacterium]MDH0615897.1 hypothetical protein [Agrobacterium sp. GD03872]MDH0698012.1 hypothetical protein [Agrobacterium sp. GD03871]MDH1061097.1 hypothetical protein [Agrobacterium sp. GD03992]MDH2211871.1 hypothetical protein [Agrobacterium sp. GD03643]MDH2221263.1 hypothetical protein [Agrobacterium sp. GD03638]